MGADQLSGVMEQVEANSARSKGITLQTDEVQARVSRFRERVTEDSKSYRTRGVVLDDGVIDPRDTRDVLGICLEVITTPGVQGSAGHRTLARL
jgi:acetyl-CoA carboxylase carboxyltransferase component